jgi:hypothetical protein
VKIVNVVLKFLMLSTLLCGVTLADEIESFKPERFEILISNSSTQAFESLFGHASILVIPEGKTWEQGLVVGFVAQTNDSSKLGYYVKGISGRFPVVMETTSALSFFNNKIIYEKRDIHRSILPLTKEQKEKLWSQILDFKKHPEKLGPYYFHIRNCASMIYFLMQKAGIQVNYKQLIATSLASGISPNDFINITRGVLLTPYPESIVPSTAALVNQIEEKYDIKLESILDEHTKDFTPWSSKEFDKLISMTTEELIFATQALSIVDRYRNMPIRGILRLRKKRAKVQFIQYVVHPRSFYNICDKDDEACFRKFTTDLEKFYPKKTLKKFMKDNLYKQWEVVTKFKPGFDFETSEQAQNWQRMTEAMKQLIDE